MVSNNYMPISIYLTNNLINYLKELNFFAKSSSSTGGSSGSGSTSGGSTSCTGCQEGCKGACTTTCKGSCSDTCKGSCSDTCTGKCKGGCKTNCYGSCSGGCEDPCTNICQTYCQKQQTFSANSAKNHPANSGNVFTWSSTVGVDKTIKISAEDWNKLAGYVNSAAAICIGGDTTNSAKTTSSGDPITAAIFNSMSERLTSISDILVNNKTGKTKKSNSSIIRASDFEALKDGFNNARIIAKKGACCQKGETPKSDYNSAQGSPS